MSARELIDLTLQLHHETERAVLVSDDGDREHAVWLARSQIEIEPKGKGIVMAMRIGQLGGML